MAKKRRQSSARPNAPETARGSATAVLAPPAPPPPARPVVGGRFGDRLIITIFLLFLLMPGLGLLLGLPGARVRLRNEAPVPPPTIALTRHSLRTWPGRFYSYFTLRLGFRARMVRYHSLLSLKVLHVSPAPDQVIRGNDGWLYLAGDGGMQSLLRQQHFSASELERWRRLLEGRRDWLRARGIKFLFVLCPDKHTIYPEYLPPAMRPPQCPSRLDELTDYLRRTSDVPVLDLRPTLLAEKPHYQVYYQLDTHWNALGAFFGYRRMCAALHTSFPDLPSPELSQFRVERVPFGSNDLVQMAGLARMDMTAGTFSVSPLVPRQAQSVFDSATLQGHAHGQGDTLITERKGAPLHSIVMLRDSFSMDLQPFVSELADRSVFMWTREFDEATVAREKPDLVIWEMVERYLQVPPPTT